MCGSQPVRLGRLVTRGLKAAGQLSYADDEVRAGMDEIAKRGLDR